MLLASARIYKVERDSLDGHDCYTYAYVTENIYGIRVDYDASMFTGSLGRANRRRQFLGGVV